MLKKILAAVLLLTMITCSFNAHAEDLFDQNAFETVKDYLDRANDAEENSNDPETALGILYDLVTYYEKNREKLENSTAKQWYNYALGRVEIDRENYTAAETALRDCGGSGYEWEMYMNYARGKRLQASGDYKGAIEAFNQCIGSPAVSPQSLNALEQCRPVYFNEAMNKAKTACENGNHDNAQEIYQEILSILDYGDYASQANAALNICLTHNSQAQTTEIGLVLKNAYAVSSDTVKLKWDGNPETYRVYWTMDLASGSSRNQMEYAEVNGHDYTVTGLKAGTAYRFIVDHNGVFQEVVVTTQAPGQYTENEFTWTGSSTVYRFDGLRTQFLDSGMTSCQFYHSGKFKSQKENVIEVSEKPIFDSCILAVFTTWGVPNAMQGQPYEIHLHIADRGTIVRTGQFGDLYVCSNADDNIYLLMYDILDEAVEQYNQLQDTDYTVDLIMDEKLIGSVNGTFK